MKNGKGSRTLSATLALALAATTAVHAVPPGKGMGKGGCGAGMGMMDGGGMMGMGGRGMKGGMGMMDGMGMMGGMTHGLYALDLSDEQRKNIWAIKDEVGKKHWDLMKQTNAEHQKLHEMFGADTRDPKAIGQQMQKVFDLRRQMMESSIDAQNRIEAVLTPEQKTQLKDAAQQGCMMMH